MKHSWWHRCLSHIRQAPDLAGLHTLCCSICRQLKIDHFLVLGGQLTNPAEAGLSALSGLPDDWWSLLCRPERFQRDPTLKHALQSHLPLFWDDLPQSLEDEGRDFIADAGTHGLVAGLTIPVHGPAGLFGVLTLANGSDHPQPEKSLQQALPRACLVAGYLVDGLLRCSDEQAQPPATVPLTGREKDCLLWTAKGKTSWEISSILHIGERTVIYHLNNVLRKLGAANRQQAVARACALGLLTPEFSLDRAVSAPVDTGER
ncbi:LuxR family transcriptional regulator [Geothermobacter hydrogeniphilus]|uniref:HTH luxR-type domain-containing protein n=1 Tax=Geothermobacter hydrogeniphilus TaxID=1969733 RepID=A0A1X0XZJ6_9BACT|nr:LuxR family transcriptional regulator [Geothermobacter hydrogeniphilus]ORJ58313.1 hypothetical protein B5V00_12715 [Geothermobacter hydrogeniphilus]